jgi:hypothetical protein
VLDMRGDTSGAPLVREVGHLFRVVTQSLDRQAPADAMFVEVAERLRRVVPTRSVRLVRNGSLDAVPGKDSIYFDVPAKGSAGAARLLVEFAKGCRLEPWHFRMLKAAVQVLAAVQEIERGRIGESQPAPAQPAADTEAPPAASDLPGGWHRVVVRYRDGRLLKGYNRDFTPASGQVGVWVTPNGRRESRISAPLAQLKAVFFVHGLEGLPPEGRSLGTAERGRRVDVTFMDDEVLSGRTLNYSAEGVGFFLFPADMATNNSRVFVVTQAIREIHFP